MAKGGRHRGPLQGSFVKNKLGLQELREGRGAPAAARGEDGMEQGVKLVKNKRFIAQAFMALPSKNLNRCGKNGQLKRERCDACPPN